MYYLMGQGAPRRGCSGCGLGAEPVQQASTVSGPNLTTIVTGTILVGLAIAVFAADKKLARA